MVFARASRYTHYGIMLLLHQTAAECVGDALNYNKSGIFVPFKNLCGQDVNAAVDAGRFRVPTREDCLTRCVMAESFCYGFDFLEHVETYTNPPRQNNCWIHGSEYTEQQTNFSGTSVSNAAMLMPDFRDKYQQICRSNGLLQCLQAQSDTTSSSSIAITSPTSTSSTSPGPTSSSLPPPASSDGLSTGAKAGIGAGIGAVALLGLIIAILLLLRRRKSRVKTDVHRGQPHESNRYAEPMDTSHASEMKVRYAHELGAQGTQELRGQDTQELKGASSVNGQRQLAELQ